MRISIRQFTKFCGFWCAAALIAFGVGFASPAATDAQIPDELTNLQFFPEDIARDELVGYMREFSFALGVRCQYCHSGGDGRSFEGVDFASDDKPTKRRARYMLEMSRTINSTLLTSVPDRETPNVDVECQTCHRGIARPVMIDDLLRTRIAADGVEAATDEYRRLREREYGGWSYDFGEWAINDLAAEYGDEDPATGAALLAMNAEFYPESLSIWVSLGTMEAAAGNREAAIRAYQRGLELSPDNQRILGLLEQLGGGR